MNTRPPATTGAAAFIDPPFAGTRLTVVNVRLVSNVQMTEPSFVACARTAPSLDGEKTTPGIAVTAEKRALLHARLGLPHTGAGGCASQARWPVVRSSACRPPGSGA